MTREELENTYEAALNDAAKQLSYRELSASALREKLLKKGTAKMRPTMLSHGLPNGSCLTTAALRNSPYIPTAVVATGPSASGRSCTAAACPARTRRRPWRTTRRTMQCCSPFWTRSSRAICPTPGQCSAQSRICSGVGFHGAISAAHSTNMAQPWMSSSTDKKRRIKEDVP